MHTHGRGTTCLFVSNDYNARPACIPFETASTLQRPHATRCRTLCMPVGRWQSLLTFDGQIRCEKGATQAARRRRAHPRHCRRHPNTTTRNPDQTSPRRQARPETEQPDVWGARHRRSTILNGARHGVGCTWNAGSRTPRGTTSACVATRVSYREYYLLNCRPVASSPRAAEALE